ncbi:hypothetical protein D9619_010881 [Psilocybe cf. subviscida]|uniref:Uncharacterized protein n=1 Tax=Psilocybe cf. subviscida TaxID=2480587 RepID=A0A8H5B9K5_9AGAR|nr:hypothetical protein D9619_010881 [Psilocybe cf. subviscida]
MKLFFLSISISVLGLFLVSLASASPIPTPRAVSYEERSASNTPSSAQILRREDDLLYSRTGSTWEAVKSKILPKKKELTEEQKRIKIWKLQNKLNKTIIKHNAAVATVEHNIGKKLIVSSYRGDPADRNMAVKKAESEWNHGHKYVDITVTEQTHKKTVMAVYHNGPGTPKTVPLYFFVHDR